MFDMLKNVSKMRDMQSKLKKEEVVAQKGETKIVMNGAFEVISVSLDPNLDQETQEKVLRTVFADAIKQVQSLTVKQFASLQ